jgi:hypothetical protein
MRYMSHYLSRGVFKECPELKNNIELAEQKVLALVYNENENDLQQYQQNGPGVV